MCVLLNGVPYPASQSSPVCPRDYDDLIWPLSIGALYTLPQLYSVRHHLAPETLF